MDYLSFWIDHKCDAAPHMVHYHFTVSLRAPKLQNWISNSHSMALEWFSWAIKATPQHEPMVWPCNCEDPWFSSKRCTIDMVYHDLRHAYSLEVGMTQIYVNHEMLFIVW
jgi:hypothetical protein